MGEYATRKSDNQEIKIGTCESMYYLRLEDKNKVIPERRSEFGKFFRIPFPDEDNVLPGDYDTPFRGFLLAGFQCQELAETAGNIQLSHKNGYLLNLPCYHGEKLPEGINIFWNGKDPNSYELKHLKETKNGIFPVVGCKYCSSIWSFDWADIWEYLSEELKERFIDYSGDILFKELTQEA